VGARRGKKKLRRLRRKAWGEKRKGSLISPMMAWETPRRRLDEGGMGIKKVKRTKGSASGTRGKREGLHRERNSPRKKRKRVCLGERRSFSRKEVKWEGRSLLSRIEKLKKGNERRTSRKIRHLGGGGRR